MNLECSFKFKYFGEEKLYTCITSKVLTCGPGAGICNIKGKHLKNKSNKHVDGFWIRSTQIRCIPKRIYETFPILSALVIEDCKLVQVLRKDLIGLENLKFFYLHGNQNLTSLDKDLFESFSNLQEISIINNNNLTGISSALIKPVLNIGLKYVDLSNNGSVGAFYCPGFEGSLNSVEELMAVIDGDVNFDAIDSRYRFSAAAHEIVKQPDGMSMEMRDCPEFSSLENNVFVDLKGTRQECQIDEKVLETELNSKSNMQKLNKSTFLKVKTESVDNCSSLIYTNQTLNAEKTIWTPAEIGSDSLIIVGPQKYQVHSSVLASQSSSFKESLATSSDLDLNSFTPDIVESFIRFLYTNQMDEDDAIKLFVMATCFKVGDLKSRCEELILKNVTTASAPHILSLGHRFNNLEFKKVAFNEMKKTFPGIDLPEDMINKPERLKEIILAAQTRKRKLLEIEQESKRLKEEADKEFLSKLQPNDKV